MELTAQGGLVNYKDYLFDDMAWGAEAVKICDV